jgi:hypothetical protein
MDPDLEIKVGVNSEEVDKAVGRIRKQLNTMSDAVADSMTSRKGWGSGFEKFEQDINRLYKKSFETPINQPKLNLPKNYDKSFVDINKELQSLSTTNVVDGYKAISKATRLATGDLVNFQKIDKEVMTFNKAYHKKAQDFKNIMLDLELKQQDTLFKRAQKKQKQLQQELAKANQQPPFAGYAMSIMFAGMAIQRTMSQITKFGTKAFNDISHSVEGTVTASDKLDGAMKYLGYTIGSAMEPVIEWLIPIVDKVAEWVDANPKLTAGLITIATVLGTIAAVGGSIKLAADGFAGLGIKLTELSNLKNSGLFGWSLSTPWIVALAALAGMVIAFTKAWNDSPAFQESFTTNILKPLKENFNSLGVSLKELGDILFQANGFFDTLGGILFFVARILVAILAPALNLIIDLFRTVIQLAIAYNQAMSGDFKGAGATLKKISFSSTKDSILGMNSEILDAWNSISKGGISLSAQTDYMNSQKLTGATGNDAKVVIMNNYMTSNNLDEFSREVKRSTNQGFSSAFV